MSKQYVMDNNSYRTEKEKEINIVDFLPDFLKGGEVHEFTKLFENYLNDMYEGETTYIKPDLLEDIDFPNHIIWSSDDVFITSPNSNFFDYLKKGDYVKRSVDDVEYYKIKNIIDKETIELTNPYISTSRQGIAGFSDNFTGNEKRDFWIPETLSSPLGISTNFLNNYKVDTIDKKFICTKVESDPNSKLIYSEGIFKFNFGIRLADGIDRNNTFGFILGTLYSVLLQNDNDGLYISLKKSSTELARFYLSEDISIYELLIEKDIDNLYSFTISNTFSKSFPIELSTWNDDGTNDPVLGYHNKWKFTDTTTVQNNFVLFIRDGKNQSLNFIELKSDNGSLVGRYDPIDIDSSIDPIDNTIVTGFYGRSYILDNNNLYAPHRDDTIPTNIVISQIAQGNIGVPIFKKAKTHFSMLEKIKRLTELHDPDLIDIDYINYFANYMGYKVDLTGEDVLRIVKKNVSDYDEKTYEEQKLLRDKYLRFIIGNLPHWYKIKSTENAINIMLYSFGMITEIKNYFATNYTDSSTWFLEDLTENVITPEHFQTPHFSIQVDLDESVDEFGSKSKSFNEVTRAVLSVKPINTVFHGLNGFIKRQMFTYVEALATTNLYLKIADIINRPS